ncbi:hypothetical protein ABT086_07610 [Streptomyces mirabilis]
MNPPVSETFSGAVEVDGVGSGVCAEADGAKATVPVMTATVTAAGVKALHLYA